VCTGACAAQVANVATAQEGVTEEALQELLEAQELRVLSVCFDTPPGGGNDKRGVAYVRLAPPPMSWLKVEASNEVRAAHERALCAPPVLCCSCCRPRSQRRRAARAAGLACSPKGFAWKPPPRFPVLQLLPRTSAWGAGLACAARC
jgi:hypothetical protein